MQSSEAKTSQRKFTHVRTKELLYEQIKNGNWPVNSIIPSENLLAQQYSVSRSTIRKALKTLEKSGILRAEQGRGRIVTSKISPKKSSSVKSIGLVVSRISSDFDFYGSISSIQQTAEKRGYHLTIYVLQSDSSSEAVTSHLNQISHKEVGGLLISCQQVLNTDIVEFNKYIPTISLLHDCAFAGIPSYYIDWIRVTYQASKHLAKQGFHEQVLLLPKGSYWNAVNLNIIKGFRYVQDENDVKFDEKEIVYVLDDYENDSFEKSLEPALARMKKGHRVGFICYYNWSVVNIIKYALANNIKVPEETAALTLVDSAFLDSSPVPVTALYCDRKEMARQATDRLLDMLEGKDEGSGNLDNPHYGKLVVRQSSAKSDTVVS